MARVIVPPGNPGPVNDGERRVLRWLRDKLSDEFALHPNLTISVDGGTKQVECDIIVVGPDCVWVVEVKDLAGVVNVGEHDFTVNGEFRRHPVDATRLKAQKIKSRISIDPQLGDVWLQPIVILAREPRHLDVVPSMRKFVMNPMQAAAAIGDPTAIGLQRDRLPAPLRKRFAERLAIDARSRPPRKRVGSWLLVELLNEDAGRQEWVARQDVLGSEAILELVRLSPTMAPNQRQSVTADVFRAARMGQKLGASERILAPSSAFTADDGTLVVVHPRSPAPNLDVIGEEIADYADDTKIKILRSVAEAIDLCHRNEIVHGGLGTSVIHVSEGGSAAVGRLGRARSFSQVRPARHAEAWPIPEGTPEGPLEDVFALLSLIHHLWPSGAPSDVANIAGAVADGTTETAAAVLKSLSDGDASPSEEMPPEPGAVFADRYRLDQPISKGAATTIFDAFDAVTSDRVAVKVYEAGAEGSRLLAEYRTLSAIAHEGIVRVRYVGQHGSHWYLVSEFVEGPDLRSLIVDAKPVAEPVGAALMVQLLDALEEVHPDMAALSLLLADDSEQTDEQADEHADQLDDIRSSGFAHRDINPENILLHPERGPVLVDFGLAARPGGAAVGVNHAYLPADAAPDAADPDVDLFAAGIVLHELLTGDHPYEDRDPVGGQLSINAALSSEIRNLIARACAPHRENRFVSAGEFRAALAPFVIGDVELPEPPKDTLETLRAIDAALAERRFDDAVALCPDDWTAVRERIELHRTALQPVAASEALLELDGWVLEKQRFEPFAVAADPSNVERGPGEAHHYLVTGPAGEALQLTDYQADDARWIQVTDTFQTGMPLKRLGQGLRLGTAIDAESMMIELGQARIKIRNDNPLWSNLFKAEPSELDQGANCDVENLMVEWGAIGYGTREEQVGDQSNRKRQMCVVAPTDVEHLPAVAFLVTRILPLARGITAS